MTSRRNYGLTGSLLLLIPMLVIPGMAVFGIPQFLPVVASPVDSEPRLREPGFREDRVGESAAHPKSPLQFDDESLDLFRSPDERRTAARPVTQSSGRPDVWTDPLRLETATVRHASSRQATILPVSNESAGSLRTASLAVGNPRVQAASGTDSRTLTDTDGTGVARYVREERTTARERTSSPAASAPITWREAATRLNRLGVRTYRLMPGTETGEFRFLCYVTSAHDPRISRRFEASSFEPLDAVHRVIQDISRWKQVR